MARVDMNASPALAGLFVFPQSDVKKYLQDTSKLYPSYISCPTIEAFAAWHELEKEWI
jgi:hypothetical protein